MPYRDFAAEATERARAYEPITFTLPGCDTVFCCVSTMPFGVVEDILAAPDPPELTPEQIAALTAARAAEITAMIAESFAAVRRFFNAVVVPEQHDAVAEAVTGADVETLREVVQWVIAEFSGRPTLPSSASQDGQPAAGEPSTSNADEKVTVPSLP